MFKVDTLDSKPKILNTTKSYYEAHAKARNQLDPQEIEIISNN